uniref:Pseudouridine synthase n=1 Tax=uncultured Bacteroidota bacterium TaxID=152509 RepID=H5SNT8_9BACT|nr:ribosomal large subunit pseudouridine synthase B [uncultured Bacteroidetes bacterium]
MPRKENHGASEAPRPQSQNRKTKRETPPPRNNHPFRKFIRSGETPTASGKKPFPTSDSPSKPSEALPEKVRLVRYLALAGVASRRQAAKIIQNGQVAVNGETVREPWRYVDTQKDQVTYKGRLIRPEKPVYILLNKPKNTLCTVRDERGRRTVLDLLEGAPPVRLYPVGRLDRNTTGILLLTNDGELTKKLLHPSSKVPRTYRATTIKPISPADVERLLRGIPLPDGVAQADEAYLEDPYTLVLTLHIGKKHIVRRMLEYLGYKLKSLDRIAFGPLTRKGVPRGKWRFLTPQEVAWLKMLPSPKDTSQRAGS